MAAALAAAAAERSDSGLSPLKKERTLSVREPPSEISAPKTGGEVRREEKTDELSKAKLTRLPAILYVT